MEAAGFEPASCEQQTARMLIKTRSAEKVAAHWLHSCDVDSRLLLVADRWDELPEHLKETIALLVAKTPSSEEAHPNGSGLLSKMIN